MDDLDNQIKVTKTISGKPINEPVVQHGPFVMNSQQEIMEAMQDFQRTQFGGWPWDTNAPVHDRGQGRFAKHIDGKVEIRPIMYVALSYDHRIIDGKESVGFLVAVKEALENPTEILMNNDVKKALEL